MRKTVRWVLLVPLVLLGVAHFDRAASLSPGDWREASREPVGLAPDPATTPEAVVQVYAARAVRWRGYFGVHTWIAAKPTGAEQYTVYEVTRWQRRRNGTVVSISDRPPDARWYGNAPDLLAEVRGPEVDAIIERIDAAARAYPYGGEYRVWPGPNSNTFTAFVLRGVPELRADLPPTAIGKDFLGARLVAGPPSGTGLQLSLYGVLGVTAALEEGLELNLLGMSFGIDPLDLAIKLPFAGQFGLLGGVRAAGAQESGGARVGANSVDENRVGEDRSGSTADAERGEAAGTADARERRRYTFSWPYGEGGAMSPRGGTTRGTAVTLAPEPTVAWQRLGEAGLSKFERDRRAILAMAGEFRTTFDFLETVGFTPGFVPGRPYQSWATERVDVIEDTGETITLQHVIVMEYVDADGNVQGPVVQKHWRQVWTYEDTSIHAYAGHDSWARVEHEPAAVEGRWSQAVYQVDDSPRYEALGDWVHFAGYSAWTSDETWRPLPRRESSVRDDYDVLIGTNRHTITPSGWVHEEENLKAVLTDDGQIDAAQAFLAREQGVNRYEQIAGFDFSARDRYWDATAPFWADVREAWAGIYARRDRFSLTTPAGGVPLFLPMFEYAAALEAGEAYDSAAGREFIRETLADYLN